MYFKKTIQKALAISALLGLSTLANAVPTLQLGIAGGTYNAATQTIVSNGPVFSLFAFLTPNSSNTTSDTYFLSMALTPSVSTPTNLGSFSVNGNTVNVTSGMQYGTPPAEGFHTSDPGDLSPHGVFPTYFRELGFSFVSTYGNPWVSGRGTSGVFNTQDNPGSGPISGSGMYFARFDVNTSNLAPGYQVHFDLYNTAICINSRGQCGGFGDIDITQFAPFSHDAESGTSVSEPGTILMLGLGIIGFAFARRRVGQA